MKDSHVSPTLSDFQPETQYHQHSRLVVCVATCGKTSTTLIPCSNVPEYDLKSMADNVPEYDPESIAGM